MVAEEEAGLGVEEPGFLALFFFFVCFEDGGLVEFFVGEVVVAVDCAVAVGFVEDGALEEIAFLEEAASLQLLDGFVN